jgi:hypothetical protein
MQICASGLLSRAEPGTHRAVHTFPAMIALRSGVLLAFVHTGSTKDSEDEAIEVYRSQDEGATWQLQDRLTADIRINGAQGGLRIAYPTEIAPGRLLLTAMLIDHTTYPGQPLFNPATEGCLPMYILLAESQDDGATWSPWRHIPLPDEIGPASLTSPIIQLPDGTLVLSIENNKHYLDASKWMQKVVLFHSRDGGQTWGPPVVAGEDPTGRIYNWDQRLGLAPDGTLGAFVWTYDSQTNRYLNVHRRISRDGGYTWSEAEDLGFADQAGRPAVLPDGRVVLPWVDRFGSHSIRARVAPSIDGAFDPASEVELYKLGDDSASSESEDTGELLWLMGLWTFGLPFAEVLPNGDVMVLYYAGTPTTMEIHWARLRV